MLKKEYFDNLILEDGGKYSGLNLEQSYRLCAEVTKSHYENFPVASLLVPKDKRKYVQVIYTFARLADDIADESDFSPEEKIKLLNEIIISLNNKTPKNPLFIALQDTLSKTKIPKDPLIKLISAFKMDSEFKQSKNWDELLFYCENSANPVGELLLRIFDEYNEENAQYSDAICTGLQLVNFWQDFSRDLKINREFIPKEILNKYKINIHNINENDSSVIATMLEEIYEFTDQMFQNGKKLIGNLKSQRLKFEIKLTLEGGMAILKKVRKQKNLIFVNRPSLKKYELAGLFFKSFFKNY